MLPLGAPTAPGDHRFFSAVYTQRVAAALALDAGELPLAHDWLEAHDHWLDWSGGLLGRAEGRLLWAHYYRLAGDHDRAYECAFEAQALATAPRQPLALLACQRFLGELRTADGEFANARVHLDAALTLADDCAVPYERLLTLLARAELCAAERDYPTAITLLGEARDRADSLAARPALARIDTLARQLVAARPTRHDPDRLSAREVAVLRLAADGLTDRQIAARLSISPRTVGQHLSSLYAKLAVPSRAAAVRLAVARGLI